MITPEEFIQEILANPDDDTPRLIFADWLEERGDSRGEFIRVQCEIAALTKPKLRQARMYSYGNSPHGAPEKFVRHALKLPRYKALLAREMELLLAHCKTWTAFLGDEATGVIFDRGFVMGLSTAARVFVREAPRWYRVTSIHQLHVSGTSTDLVALVASPCLSHIQMLDYAGQL